MTNDESKKIIETISQIENLDDENFIEFYDAEFDNMETIALERTTAWGWVK